MEIVDEYENLLCPLSLDWLEDPITLPCCGNAVSKPELLKLFDYKQVCPLCRASLSEVDPNTIPINKNLAYLVQEAKQKGVKKPEHVGNLKNQKWKAIIHKLTSNSYNNCSLGYLNIKCLDPKYKFKTLLLPVIDESGSMSGAPTQQVKYALQRIVDLTFQNTNIITNMIGYSDNATSYFIDSTSHNNEYYQREVVSKFGRGGGTSFTSAFNEIIKSAKKFQENLDITSVVIIFLTDGEDSSSVKRSELVSRLKKDFVNTWKIDFTVHCIGFGSHHDYEFLNSLRQIGTMEGAYRYADPKEDTDSLSKKIFSITDVIAASTSIPISIADSNGIEILSGDSGNYWLNLSNINLTVNHKLVLKINNSEETVVYTEYAEDENEKEIWNKWLSSQIDQIASELLDISNTYKNNSSSLECQLHLELLVQRMKGISINLSSDSHETDRVTSILSQIKVVQQGGAIDQQKLNDMKFEGKFVTKPKEITKSTDIIQHSAFASLKTQVKVPWINIKKSHIDLTDKLKYKEEVYVMMRSKEFNKAAEYAEKNAKELSTLEDSDANNPLMIASYIGRYGMIESFIKSGCFDINKVNKLGFTALDLAVINGFYISTKILLTNGATFNASTTELLMTCISKGYKKTAEILISNKLVFVSEELADSAPTQNDQFWLRNRIGSGVPIEMAILKGGLDIVEAKINDIKDVLSWKPFLTIFNKPSADHIKIIDLLLENKKVDANEEIEVDVLNNEGTYDKDIIWPLFACCEKGNIELFDTLVKYVDMKKINKQSLKGTTCLWIACCNNKIDIVLSLLNYGADPNICNFKGDSPLIACCQKGLNQVATALLESGIKIDSYNKNRDSPVILCCRTGQYRMLELILSRLEPNEVKAQLELKANIDGFNAILAATEQEKVECIKMCVKYGADIEFRTDIDNPIISGATPLHLACFYGKHLSAQALVELGADLKSVTLTTKQTPLHIAIKQGQSSVVRYLLKHTQARECLLIKDKDEKLPSYYASMTGNEEIFEEFFRNKLAEIIFKVLISGNPELEKRCTDILLKFGQTLFCYTYRDIVEITYENGSSILSQAVLTGNYYLTEKLISLGADVNKLDDYYISPAFWMLFLDFKALDLSKVDSATFERVNVLKEIIESNLQYKMFLKKPKYEGQLINGQNKYPVGLVKMFDGYSYKLTNSSIANISKESEGKMLSLVGFADQMTNSKNFPDGKKSLELILWEAKIHVLKLLASGRYGKLNPTHLFSLYLYTSNQTIFETVNSAIINWKNETYIKPLVLCLYQSISLIPSLEGEVYRCVNVKFQLKEYMIGDVLTWPTFSFASSEWKLANDLINNRKGIIFIIQSKTGRNISLFSRCPVDNDVVFLPGSKFKILNHYFASVIALGQANIRKSTFTMKEKDISKVEQGETSIIVELEEILENECVNINQIEN